MKPKKIKHDPHGDFFRQELRPMLDDRHILYILADVLDWEKLHDEFSQYFGDTGHPAKSVRLVCGLFYLKALYEVSDEQLVSHWVENPYWQWFCGEQYFEHKFPLDPSVLSKWRKRLGPEKLKHLLRQLYRVAVDFGFLKPKDFEKLIVDTTVQEKAIEYPTDGKLYWKMLQRLLKLVKVHGIKLRQSYVRKSKEVLNLIGRYGHAKQYRRMRAAIRQIKGYLGRVMRDIGRQMEGIDDEALLEALELSKRLLTQKQDDKNKLYSIHAPEVECISKGKANKRYEFGVKVALVMPAKKCFVLCSEALHGNPYDGHTLKGSLDEAIALTGIKPKAAFVDEGYKGHGIEDIAVFTSRQKRGVTPSIKRWIKRRSAIEPIIGHMKRSHGLDRNYLKGVAGDKINALMAAIGFNLKQLINYHQFNTA